MTDQDHSVDLTSPEPPQRAVDAGAAPEADLALTPDGPADEDGPSRAGSSAARRRRRGSRGGRGRRRPGGADGADGLDDVDGGADDEPADDAEDEAGRGGDEARGADRGRAGCVRRDRCRHRSLASRPPVPTGTRDRSVDAGRRAAAGGGRRRRRGRGQRWPSPEGTGGELPRSCRTGPSRARIQDVEAADEPSCASPRSATAVPLRRRPRRPHVRSAKVERASRVSAPTARRAGRNKRRRKTSRASGAQAKGHVAGPVALDADVLERRRGRERKGRPVGRYLMCVHVRPELAQIAVLEGRNLIEHYVSRPADDVAQIHGNIYLGRVQNVLPGMEAAFVDIGTPKNAVLYRGDVQYDAEDMLEPRGKAAAERPRIEQMLKASRSSSARSRRTPSGPRAPGSRRRCRCPAGSWCSSPTPGPTASPSGCPTTSAGASGRSSTG